MPPSPPPPAQAIIQVDPDSASLDHLLEVLDAARAHATAPLAGEPGPEPSSPPPPTRRRRRRPDDSPPLASHLGDLAADTLAQRHAARRQRELEWDERDNLDRARRALLSSLTAGDDGLGLESSDDGEPALDRLGAAERFFNMAADLVQAGADDNVARHHVESDHGPSSDDDDHDGWVDAGHVDDFHLGGFDGDMFDLPDDDESGDDDVHFGDAWAQPRPAATSPSADFRSMLPGFAGERPLNPPHVAPSDVYSAPSPDPVVPYLSRDPSSALSYSSFLQPGATFVGEQTFGVRSRARAQHGPSMSLDGAPEPSWADPAEIALAVRQGREAALRYSGAPTSAVSTAHPEFAPQPSSAGIEQPPRAMSSSATRRRPPPWRAAAAPWDEGSAGASISSATGAGAAAGAAAQARAAASTSSGPRAETDPLLAILRGRSSPSSRYAPYSASSSTSLHVPVPTQPAGAAAGSSSSTSPSTAPAFDLAPLSLNAAARARARVAQSVNPAARTSRSSWGEVGEELLLRAVAREREREAEFERGPAKGRGGREDESWNVKVRSVPLSSSPRPTPRADSVSLLFSARAGHGPHVRPRAQVAHGPHARTRRHPACGLALVVHLDRRRSFSSTRRRRDDLLLGLDPAPDPRRPLLLAVADRVGRRVLRHALERGRELGPARPVQGLDHARAARGRKEPHVGRGAHEGLGPVPLEGARLCQRHWCVVVPLVVVERSSLLKSALGSLTRPRLARSQRKSRRSRSRASTTSSSTARRARSRACTTTRRRHLISASSCRRPTTSAARSASARSPTAEPHTVSFPSCTLRLYPLGFTPFRRRSSSSFVPAPHLATAFLTTFARGWIGT